MKSSSPNKRGLSAFALFGFACVLLMALGAVAPASGNDQEKSAVVFEHGYAEVNGVRLHYAKAGKGKLILFLHGFPDFWYVWRAQLRYFARDYLVVAPDNRGYNLSSKPRNISEYTVDRIVADVRALAGYFGRERIILVGHDWGGAIAWEVAIAHPDLIERLVIINAPHPAMFVREILENEEQQKASRYINLFRSPEAENILSRDDFGALRRSVLRPLQEQGSISEADAAAYLAAWRREGALTGALNWYRAVGALDIPEDGRFGLRLPTTDGRDLRVFVPTLVIWGLQDKALLPGLLSGLEEFVADLDILRIAEAGHFIPQERPDLVNAKIREFISRRER